MALGSGEIKAVLFVATMLAGMGLFEVFDWRARLASSIDTHAPY